MPIYEYQCQKCSTSFEVLFKSSSQEQTPLCKKCGSEKVEKLFSAFATMKSSNNMPAPVG